MQNWNEIIALADSAVFGNEVITISFIKMYYYTTVTHDIKVRALLIRSFFFK